MTNTDLSSYKSLYLQTGKEYVNKMSVSLSQLSNDVLNKDALNNLHIASHSLRSQSQVMGFMDVAEICLNIEKISDYALKGITKINNETILKIKKEVGKMNELCFAQDNIEAV